MNILKFSKWQYSFVVIIISAFIFSACENNELIDPLADSPEVPSITSMQMDFDSFPSQNNLSKIGGNQNLDEILTKGNVGFAAVNIVVWRSLIRLGMVIPVAAFAESFNHEAEQQDDERWLWTYNFTPNGGVKHTASLYADVGLSEVKWEMYVTKENEFTDFLWFSGESNLTATDGTWILNHHPQNPTPWIGIDWHRNPTDSTGNIKYTNIVPDGNENGGFISYRLVSDSTYNTFFDIYNKGKKQTTNIKWNRDTHEGRVRDSLHFGNSNWHCWDANLEDIDCQ